VVQCQKRIVEDYNAHAAYRFTPNDVVRSTQDTEVACSTSCGNRIVWSHPTLQGPMIHYLTTNCIAAKNRHQQNSQTSLFEQK